MFSWGDLKLLKSFYNNATPNNVEFVVLILIVRNLSDPANPNVYSIKVNDIAKLADRINDDLAKADGADLSEKIDNIHKDLANYYKDNANDIEKGFLERYGDYGISISKANNALDNWSTLSLQKNSATNTNTVVPTPCP